MTGSAGEAKGFAFATFTSCAHAEKAISTLNGKVCGTLHHAFPSPSLPCAFECTGVLVLSIPFVGSLISIVHSICRRLVADTFQ